MKNKRENFNAEPNPTQKEVDEFMKELALNEFGEKIEKFLYNSKSKNKIDKISKEDKIIIENLKKDGWKFLGKASEVDSESFSDKRIKLVGQGNYFLVFEKKKI